MNSLRGVVRATEALAGSAARTGEREAVAAAMGATAPGAIAQGAADVVVTGGATAVRNLPREMRALENTVRNPPAGPLSPQHQAASDLFTRLDTQVTSLGRNAPQSLRRELDTARRELDVFTAQRAAEHATTVSQTLERTLQANRDVIPESTQRGIARGLGDAHTAHADALRAAGRESEAITAYRAAGEAYGRAAFLDLGTSGRVWVAGQGSGNLGDAIAAYARASRPQDAAALLSRANLPHGTEALSLISRSSNEASSLFRENMRATARALINRELSQPFTVHGERLAARARPITDGEFNQVVRMMGDPTTTGADVRHFVLQTLRSM